MKHTSTIIIAALAALVSHGQEGKSFSLQQAIDHAVQHNYQLQQSRLDVELSRAKVKETTAIGLPQVNGEASFNNFIDIPTQVAKPFDISLGPEFDSWLYDVSEATGAIYQPPTPDPNALQEFQFGLPYTGSVGVTATQLIFNGSYFVGLKAAREYVRASELGLKKSETEVRSAVSQAYYAALATQKSVDALKESKANADKIYTEATALYEAGIIEKQDADQMKLLRSTVSNQLDFVQRQQANVMNLLKFTMGMPVADSITLTDDIDALVEAQNAASLSLIDQPFSAERHIDFQTITQGEELTRLSLSNERARFYPQMAAFFTHSQNGFGQDFGKLFSNKFYPTTLWGVKLTVPIFSSFQGHQRVQQAKLNLAKLESQKMQLEQGLNMQAMSAKSTYKSALDRYQTAKEDLALANSIKERTRVKFNAGMAGSNDLTAAENQYLATLGNYINTTLELLNSKTELDKALGN